jgi:PKD repeat protein
MKHLFTLLALVAFTVAGWAQNSSHRCGTMEVHDHLMNTNPEYAQRRNVVAQHTRNYEEFGAQNDVQRVVYTIPVVFHVVYQNATENISDAQLLSQIDVLNEDFRKLNANFGQTPSVFQGVAADVEIEFCLANIDPNGAPTTGITRTQTTTNTFNTNDNVKFNSSGGKNAWPAEKYLNFWVADLGNSLLGYAQFPGGPANTDGVVCTYTSIGKPPANPFGGEFNLGRTATHEIGHWLNLYHIWGNEESGCGNSPGSSGTDEVSDTPVQDDATAGCPSFPQISCNNGPNGDMFMNYMDYMYDDCATMFTNGQKTRSRALFVVGGERYSLLSANVCTSAPPTPGNACSDTLRFPLVGTEAIYGDATVGYVAGTNTYNDQEKADKFTAVAPYTRVKGGFFKFAVANANGVSNHNVTFKLYDDDGTGGLPGTVLATTTVPLSTITASVNADAYTQVTFPTPITVSGSFYLSYVVSPASGIEICLYTNTDGNVTTNTAYELFEDGSWHAYTEEPASWGLAVNHAISAWMETIPPTASFSINDNSVCAGTQVTYTSTTTGSSSIQWTFPGGSPSTSTQANPTVTYNNAGTYGATLIANGTCANQSVTQTQNNFIVVSSTPNTPVITNNNGTLSLGIISGSIQWFVNNVAISGANTSTHFPTSVGNYTASVTVNGCTSTSTPFAVSSVGIFNAGSSQTLVFPNPANDFFIIQPSLNANAETFTVLVTDLSGKEVIRKSFNNVVSGTSLEIPTSDLAVGMYQLIMLNNNEKQVAKIAVSR